MGKATLTAFDRASPHTPRVGVAPRPWRLEVDPGARGPRQMTVYAADGEVVEHRTSGGHRPKTSARCIANARHYVTAVNAQEVQDGEIKGV